MKKNSTSSTSIGAAAQIDQVEDQSQEVSRTVPRPSSWAVSQMRPTSLAKGARTATTTTRSPATITSHWRASVQTVAFIPPKSV